MTSLPIERRSLWRKWIVVPVLTQLRQGFTPEKIALTVALGAMLGIFPVLGSSTALCAVAGFALRLNQPVLQTVNYVAYPLQIALIPVFIRAGEHLFGAPPLAFSIPQILKEFRAAPAHFFREFELTILHCVTAWLLFAPVCGVIIYFALRPILHAAGTKLRKS